MMPLSRFCHDTDGPGRTDPDILNHGGLVLLVSRGHVAATGKVLDYRSSTEFDSSQLSYLGKDGQTRYYMASAENGEGLVSVRDLAPDLSGLEAGLATVASALEAWHRQARYCTRCGGANLFAAAGWEAQCTQCGAQEYPRQDPSVIMAIRDEADRLLLGHGASWAKGRYSCLAGFVEAGESFENAVARESFEEAGIVIDRVEYVGSQPWPFPRSTMVAFRAWTSSAEDDIAVDGVEVTDARFFTREELARELAEGRVSIPSKVSAGRALIEDWFGEPLHSPTD